MYTITNISGITLYLGWHEIKPKESITLEAWDYASNKESIDNAKGHNLVNVIYVKPVETNVTGEESTPEVKPKRTRKSKKEIN